MTSPFTYASDVFEFLVDDDGALILDDDGASIVDEPVTESWANRFRSRDASAKPVIARYDE